MDGLRILGDWGVSACRLWLHDGYGIVATQGGQGIKFTDDPARAFADMTAGWREEHGDLPALLCGTVGANIGWQDASYVLAPAGAADIAHAGITVGNEVSILPGTRTEANSFGLPDVMRSEDVQSLGWGRLHDNSDALLCLPGSHTKWVTLGSARITDFATSFVGELFDVLVCHTILTRSRADDRGANAAFMEGVEAGLAHPAPISGLFHIRARTAQNLDSTSAARDRLSGYLVGADCAAMVRALGRAPDAVIGDGAVADAYRKALLQMGYDVPLHDGEACAVAGLVDIAAHL